MDFAHCIDRFFDNSPKRHEVFDGFIPEGENKRKLKELCLTRWVERHDAFEVFILLYKPLVHCLDNLSTAPVGEWNRETRNDACLLLTSLLRFPLIVALMLTRAVLLMTEAPSIKLQGTYMDIVRAHEEVELVKQHLKRNREEVDAFHQRIYNAAVALAEEVGLSEETPRVVGRQQHGTSPAASIPCGFYRRSTTVPLLDHLQIQLEERFSTGSH